MAAKGTECGVTVAGAHPAGICARHYSRFRANLCVRGAIYLVNGLKSAGYWTAIWKKEEFKVLK